jgi:hypothetical protein
MFSAQQRLQALGSQLAANPAEAHAKEELPTIRQIAAGPDRPRLDKKVVIITGEA